MRRRLLNLLATLSLLVCVAVCVLWVRSHSVFDEAYWIRPVRIPPWPRYDVWRAASGRGRISFTYYRSSGMRDFSTPSLWAAGDEWGLHLASYPAPDVAHDRTREWWHGAGFSYQRIYDPYKFDDYRRLTIPHWLLGVLPATGLARATARRLRRRVQVNRGLCPRCGYDLRATPGRCPECGTTAPSTAA